MVTAVLEQIKKQGFAIYPNAISEPVLSAFEMMLADIDMQNASTLQRDGKVYAIRHLLDVCPELTGVLQVNLMEALLKPLLGDNVFLTKAIYFNKIPQANWKVPWHQDTSITVTRKENIPGYQAWSLKAGVHYVQPPEHVLKEILTIRLHLDDSNEYNGALRALPGTHKLGKLSSDAVKKICNTVLPVTCAVERGGLLIMRPLLLHASNAAEVQKSRRILHLEFSTENLAFPLQWYGT